MTDANHPTSKKRSVAPVIALVVGGVSLVMLFAGIRLFVFQPFRIPAASMVPTISAGAHAWAHLREKKPVRGGIFVFPYPEQRERLFAKRVIGLEGDVIAVDLEQVTINGWKVPRCPVGKWTYSDGTETRPGQLFMEYLGDLTYLVSIDDQLSGMNVHQGPFKVMVGHYFVMGDNRDNSHDSRMWDGGRGAGVPNGDTVGRIRAFDTPRLPPGNEGLRAAFDACLAKRPAETNPPPPAAM